MGDKKIVRVNILANCVDKYIQDGEKKYASLTVDDASGQIRLKNFGDDISVLKDIMQGDTLQIIGNVREWKAVVDYAVTMAAGSYIITVDCLPDFLLSRDQQNGKNCGFRFHSSEERRKLGPLSEIIQRVEEAVIREALQKAKNKSEAIRMLGISRRTFYTKIKQYNLE